MSEQIITVSVAPSINTILWMDRLSAEQENTVSKELVEPAGGALGISRVLAALQCENVALGFCGQDNEQSFFGLLERFGIRYDFIPCRGETRQDIFMLLPKNTVIKTVRKGFQPGRHEIGSLIRKLDSYPLKDNFLVISGDSDALPLFEKWRDSGARLVLRSPRLSKSELFELNPYYAIFTLNDLKTLTGINFRSETTISRCIREISDYVEHVAVFLGTRGYLYAEKGVCYRILLPHRERLHPEINDLFTAGYLAAQQKELPFEDLLRYAAGCAIFEPGSERDFCVADAVWRAAQEIQLERVE